MYGFYRLSTMMLSRLPFKALYLISDGVAWMLHSLFKYRRSVVEKQLAECFPDWDEATITSTSKEVYRNLADIMVESFKTDRLSKEEMMKRFTVLNPEEMNAVADQGGNSLVLGAHFNNWEWGSVAVNHFFRSTIYGLYKPVANKLINSYINEARMKVGTFMIPIQETRKLFENPLEAPSSVVFVADQSPSNVVDAVWVDFFGKDTACLHGIEKYAEMTGWPVFFWRVYRVKRGHYEVDVTPIRYEEDGKIIQRYMKLLEEDIRKHPSSWLWTHKRWKRSREEAITQAEKRKIRALKP